MRRGGVYGTLGTPAVGNLPGSRVSPTTWTDAAESLAFWGAGYDANGNNGVLNDLWTFNPTTVFDMDGGSSTESQAGVYGTMARPVQVTFLERASHQQSGRQEWQCLAVGGKARMPMATPATSTIFGSLIQLTNYGPGWAETRLSTVRRRVGVYGTLARRQQETSLEPEFDRNLD